MTQAEIQILENQLTDINEKLKKLYDQQRELKALGPEYVLAEYLHSKLCHYAHEDQCGWYYSDWKDSELRYARKQYLDKARSITYALEMNITNDPYIITRIVLES